MCGRYTLTVSLSEIEARFGCPPSKIEWRPRYNLAPSQQGLVVIRADKQNLLREMKWGLVPHWAKDASIGSRLINARLETLNEKPAFRESLARRRCIIPADGFYEWQKRAGGKVPFRTTLETGDAFGLAGLWDSWISPSGEVLQSFTIITTEAAQAVRSIHNRMPLILPSDLEQKWLAGPEGSGKEAMKRFMVLMHPEIRLRAYRVPEAVNRPAVDNPQCIEEIPDE